MKITRYAATTAMLALVTFPITAYAMDKVSDSEHAVSATCASAIALAAQPGTIAEAELDQFEGKPAYDVEVLTEAGDEVEFKIDAKTGEILNVWTDDDPADDPISGAAEETDG